MVSVEGKYDVGNKYIDVEVAVSELYQTIAPKEWTEEKFSADWIVAFLRTCRRVADDVIVQRGEWLWDSDGSYHCSRCGRKIRIRSTVTSKRYPFCPQCGSENRGEFEFWGEFD